MPSALRLSNRNAANSVFVENVATLNVKLVMRQIAERSPVLSEMLDKGEIALISGMYDVETGYVDFHRSLASVQPQEKKWEEIQQRSNVA